MALETASGLFMLQFDFKSFAERIYEAAFIPELWPSLLDDMASATGSGMGGIGIYWPKQRGIASTSRISPGTKEWEQPPEQTRTWLKHVRAGQFINRGFFQVDPYRGDWSDIPDFGTRLRRHIERGFGAQIATIIEQFNGEIITLEFTRKVEDPRYDDELISKLDDIHNAFKQAVFFSSRLYFEQARGTIETLNAVGLPTALLGENGQILQTNALFNTVENYFISRHFGKVSIAGSESLRKSFAHALELSIERNVSVPIPVHGSGHAAVVHFMPLCRQARSIFASSYAIMIVSPASTAIGVPSSELLSGLFRLTQAEARLAAALASGLSLRDCAAGLGIAFGTARSYLLRIFSKTGTSQQSELVSLLKSISTPRDAATIILGE